MTFTVDYKEHVDTYFKMTNQQPGKLRIKKVPLWGDLNSNWRLEVSRPESEVPQYVVDWFSTWEDAHKALLSIVK